MPRLRKEDSSQPDKNRSDPYSRKLAPDNETSKSASTYPSNISAEGVICPHEHISRENPFDLLPIFRCSQCGALPICECELDWFKRYDPSRLRRRLVDRIIGDLKEPIPTERPCYSCRGVEEPYTPASYGRHLFSRKNWRTIMKRHIELLDHNRQDLQELQTEVNAFELRLKELLWGDIENGRYVAVLRHPVQGRPLAEMDSRTRARHEFSTWRDVKNMVLVELRDGISVLTGDRLQVALQFATAEKAHRHRLKCIEGDAENDIRRAAGVPLIGQGWISETELFNLVKRLFAPSIVIQHARMPWLGRQHLDIYVPDHALAIEYMGEQHTEPLDHFGGEEGLRTRQVLDQRKRDLCRQQGIHLVEIASDEEVSTAYVERRLSTYLKKRKTSHAKA